MNNGYNAGYILAPFTYEKPFVMFLPLMAVIYQMSKFITPAKITSLIAINIISGSLLAKYLVD